MGEDIDKLLFLALGFLSGLLGSMVLERFRRQLDRDEFEVALLHELRDLRLRLGWVAFHVRRVRGTVDHAFLAWLRPLGEHDWGPEATKMTEVIDHFLAAPEQELANTIAAFNALQPEGLISSFKKYYAPVLASRIGQLGSMPARSQVTLLDVEARVRMYNEEIERYKYFVDMTFTATGANHARVTANAVSGENQVGIQAEIIANIISKLPQLSVNN